MHVSVVVSDAMAGRTRIPDARQGVPTLCAGGGGARHLWEQVSGRAGGNTNLPSTCKC